MHTVHYGKLGKLNENLIVVLNNIHQSISAHYTSYNTLPRYNSFNPVLQYSLNSKTETNVPCFSLFVYIFISMYVFICL